MFRSYLVDRGKIAVGVGKGRVDLDGPGVALQGSLYVLHLFEGVAHVRVGIGEGGSNPMDTNTKSTFD